MPTVRNVVRGPSGPAQDAAVGNAGGAQGPLQLLEVPDGLRVHYPHLEALADYLEGCQDATSEGFRPVDVAAGRYVIYWIHEDGVGADRPGDRVAPTVVRVELIAPGVAEG